MAKLLTNRTDGFGNEKEKEGFPVDHDKYSSGKCQFDIKSQAQGSGQAGDRNVKDLSGHDGMLAMGAVVISSEEQRQEEGCGGASREGNLSERGPVSRGGPGEGRCVAHVAVLEPTVRHSK